MWYTLSRIAFWFGLILVPIMFLLLSKISNWKIRTTFVICIFLVMVIAFVISGAFPVENLIFSFKSPENVLAYYVGSDPQIIDVIYGEHSCLILYDKYRYLKAASNMKAGDYRNYKNWYFHIINESSSTGYKLPDNHIITKIRHELDEDGSFTAYHVNGTDDYYLYGTTILNETGFELVYGYSNSLDGLKDNIKKINVTLELGSLPTWEFIE